MTSSRKMALTLLLLVPTLPCTALAADGANPKSCAQLAGPKWKQGTEWLEIDPATAIKVCRSELAASANAEAASANLARALIRDGRTQEASEVLNAAMRRGSPEAAALLGMESERQVEIAFSDLPERLAAMVSRESLTEAENYYTKAAMASEPIALNRLGWMLETGANGTENPSAAIEHYRRAAEAGDPLGLSNVGWAYEHGVGVPISLETAAVWYAKAAEAGDEWSLLRLGVMRQESNQNTPTNQSSQFVENFVLNYRSIGGDYSSVMSTCEKHVGATDGLAARIMKNRLLNKTLRDQLLALGNDLLHNKRSIPELEKEYRRLALSSPEAVPSAFEFYLIANLPAGALNLLPETLKNIKNSDERSHIYRLLYTVVDKHKCPLIRGTERETIVTLVTAGYTFLAPIAACMYSVNTDTSDSTRALEMSALAVAYEDPAAINFAAKQISDESGWTKESMRMYRLAARAGLLMAQQNVSAYYRDADNYEFSPQESVRWAYLGHLQGHPRSSSFLFDLCRNGKWMALSEERCDRYAKSAAESGNAEAAFYVAGSLADIEENRSELAYWLYKAHSGGDEEEKAKAMELIVGDFGASFVPEITAFFDTRLSEAEKVAADGDNMMKLVEHYQNSAAMAVISDNPDRAAKLAIAAAEMSGHYLDVRYSRMSPYFRLLSRACVYGNLSRELHDMGSLQDLALFYAIRSVNLLQDARVHLKDLDSDLRECFARVHEDRYRWLADLLIEMGQLSAAEEVLYMLADFKDAVYVNRRSMANASSLATLFSSSADDALSSASNRVSEQALLAARARADLRSKAKLGLTPEESKELRRLDGLYSAYLHQFKSVIDKIVETRAAIKDGVDTAGSHPTSALSTGLKEYLARSRRDGEPAAALYGFVLPDRTSLLAVTEHGYMSHQWEISSTELNKLVSKFRSHIQGLTTEDSANEALYNNLVLPFRDQLDSLNVRRLLISLDRGLSYVPMAALHDGERYLIESFSFATLSLDSGAEPWRHGDGLHAAAFGVSIKIGDFDPLTFVPQELRAVVRAPHESYGAMPGRRWIDDEFTASSVQEALANAPSVVHFATHFVLGRSEENSYLLLGDGSKLTMQQIAGDFNFQGTKLVVLSACNTGAPVRTDSDTNFESAARRLQHVGQSETVMGTLWPVVDGSTAAFMARFYAVLSTNHGISPSDALALTQREFLSGVHAADPTHEINERASQRRWNEPRYWAPFVVAGKP